MSEHKCPTGDHDDCTPMVVVERIVCEACQGVGCGACHEGYVYYFEAANQSPASLITAQMVKDADRQTGSLHMTDQVQWAELMARILNEHCA